MDVSQQDAQESLEVIQQVATQVRKTVARSGAPFYLILWGAIWFVGYLANHILPEVYQGWVWLSLSGLGAIISGYFGYRASLRFRVRGGGRFYLIGLAFIVYILLWLWIAAPTSGEQASTLVVLFIMFSYIVMGLWMEPVLVWVGVLLTVLTLIGYFVLTDYYNLWMAFLGGGGLAASGFYIQRSWK